MEGDEHHQPTQLPVDHGPVGCGRRLDRALPRDKTMPDTLAATADLHNPPNPPQSARSWRPAPPHRHGPTSRRPRPPGQPPRRNRCLTFEGRKRWLAR
jgi:hypothetical protein